MPHEPVKMPSLPTTKPETSGWLAQAARRHSPNQDTRSDEHDISLLIIHSISLPPMKFGGPYIEQLFSNTLQHDEHPYFSKLKGLKVSAHLLIRRDGELLQFVPLHRRAWHAGVSRWGGRTGCNDFSIGIELEGCEQTPFTVAQYRTLAATTADIMRLYPDISAERIVGHCHVAPERKTDPGPCFDWTHFHQELESTLRISCG